MIAKENLMLGNLVIYQDELCKVTILSSNGSIGIIDKRQVNTIVDGRDLNPVQIEEIYLKKLGFKQDDYSHDTFEMTVESYSFDISPISHNKFCLRFCSSYSATQCIIVSSVHQLQNAINVITGKSLELELQ